MSETTIEVPADVVIEACIKKLHEYKNGIDVRTKKRYNYLFAEYSKPKLWGLIKPDVEHAAARAALDSEFDDYGFYHSVHGRRWAERAETLMSAAQVAMKKGNNAVRLSAEDASFLSKYMEL